MSDMEDIIKNAARLRDKLIEDKKFDEASVIRDHILDIEKSVRALDDLLRANDFYWVTEENLFLPQAADDVPDAKDGEYPFVFPATCPYCKVYWRFSESACERFSIRLNMCTIPESVITCPSCRKRSMIAPTGKVNSKEVGDGAGISFRREGAVLRKVD